MYAHIINMRLRWALLLFLIASINMNGGAVDNTVTSQQKHPALRIADHGLSV